MDSFANIGEGILDALVRYLSLQLCLGRLHQTRHRAVLHHSILRRTRDYKFYRSHLCIGNLCLNQLDIFRLLEQRNCSHLDEHPDARPLVAEALALTQVTDDQGFCLFSACFLPTLAALWDRRRVSPPAIPTMSFS